MIDFITINLGNDIKMGCQDEKYFNFSIRIFNLNFFFFGKTENFIKGKFNRLGL